MQGKQLVLNLHGRTLAPGEAYLHMPVRELSLAPTPIGLPEPHVHHLELPNFGDEPLSYALLLDEMAQLNALNFAFPVLSCAAPNGVIPPGRVARVPIAFHPLEVRDYAVSVPLHAMTI